jgi:hypothetical protein
MEPKEILQMADHLMFTKMGRHLDDLQQTILQGTLEGKKYAQIADQYGYAHGYVRESASELWQLLSEVLGEDIKKSNCRSTFERLRFSNHSSYVTEYIQIGNSNINICRDTFNPSQLPQTVKNYPSIDLDQSPILGKFYGRKTELKQLKQWVLEEKAKLITIYGLIGIGKTFLSLKFVNQIKNEFSIVIYRQLSNFKSLSDLQLNLIEFLATQFNNHPLKISLINENEQRKTLLNFLRTYRCLIVIDDIQTLFQKGQLAACYQPEYKNYREFFEILGTSDHQSCLILNSREVPREIIHLSETYSSIRLLNLTGLGENSREILEDKGLQNKEIWEQLITYYEGHPLYLTLVTLMIKELFNGRVKDFLNFDQIILPDDIIALLNEQFDLLSEKEKKVMGYFSPQLTSLSLPQLISKTNCSPSDLLNILQSLIRRSLVQKIEIDETQFKINSQVIAEYCQHITIKLYKSIHSTEGNSDK